MENNGISIVERDGVKLLQFNHIAGTGIFAHGVSTRVGGVSLPPYDTLNMGFTTLDNPGHLAENRLRFMKALGLEGQPMTWQMDLVHGNDVLNYHLLNPAAMPIACDGLACGGKDIPISATFADCVPILLADPVKRAFAVIHAGWRGTFALIALMGVESLEEAFGSRRGDILAGIGPCIGRCCFMVGREVADAFCEKFPDLKDLIAASSNYEKWSVDLSGLNEVILQRAGVKAKNVVKAGLCTRCADDLFFSYRRDGAVSGRMAAVMARIS
jgi:hypothetical protein